MSQILRPRQPWAAVVLTLLTAGLGHLYVGEPRLALKRWALLFFLGIGVLLVIIFAPMVVIALPIAIVGLYFWIARDAARLARAAPRDYQLRRYNRWYVYLAVIAAASLIGQVPKLFVEAFRQPSGSMQNALLLGDWMYVLKGPLLPEPALGQVVVFRSPEAGEENIVKRIVGVPGDTLRMQAGAFYRNGVRPEEPHLAVPRPDQAWGDSAEMWRFHNWGPVVVPRDSFFMLGDNRDQSKDSRFFGFVGRDRIFGHAYTVYYSYDPEGDTPLPFLTAIRWSRLGYRIQ